MRLLLYLFVSITAFFIVYSILVFISGPSLYKINDTKTSGRIISKTSRGFTIESLNHDGHKWVVWSYGEGSIVHHPDCPCLNK